MKQRQRRTLSEYNSFPDGKLNNIFLMVAEIKVHGAQFYTFTFLRMLVMMKIEILIGSLDTMRVILKFLE